MSKVQIIKNVKRVKTSLGVVCLVYDKDKISNSLLSAEIYNEKYFLLLKLHQFIHNGIVWLKMKILD